MCCMFRYVSLPLLFHLYVFEHNRRGWLLYLSSIADPQLGYVAVAGVVWTSVDTQVCSWLRMEIKVFGFQLENHTFKYLDIYFSCVWNWKVLYIVLFNKTNSPISVISEIATLHNCFLFSLHCLMRHINATLDWTTIQTCMESLNSFWYRQAFFYINLYFYRRPALFIWGSGGDSILRKREIS